MTTTQSTHALTRSGWRELNRLIDAREKALTELQDAIRRDGAAVDTRTGTSSPGHSRSGPRRCGNSDEGLGNYLTRR